MDPLSQEDYQIQIREISRWYGYIREDPSLANTWIGCEARARLDTLSPGANPNGQNMPLIRALGDLVR